VQESGSSVGRSVASDCRDRSGLHAWQAVALAVRAGQADRSPAREGRGGDAIANRTRTRPERGVGSTAGECRCADRYPRRARMPCHAQADADGKSRAKFRTQAPERKPAWPTIR